MPAAGCERLGGGGEAGAGGLGVAGAEERVGEAQGALRGLRIEVDDLLVEIDRVARAAGGLHPGGGLFVDLDGLGGALELEVEIRHARGEVAEAVRQVRQVLLHQIARLLVGGDGLHREAGGRVELGHLLEGGDRVLVALGLEEGLPELEHDARVLRIRREELLVLRERLVEPLLLDERLGVFEDLVPVRRHGASIDQSVRPV